MVHASLQTFVADGVLGPIRLGTSRAMIQALLGEPDHASATPRRRARQPGQSTIWKYGDIELHFEARTDQVELICLEHFTFPVGGAKLNLDPWILQRTLTIEVLEHALIQAGIPNQRVPVPHPADDHQWLQAGVGVAFLFTTRAASFGSPNGLTALFYGRSPDQRHQQ